ncbi:MAG: PEP-CTERM sorting domain-containing protein [Alphaproteobacteria bacterium]
MQTILRLSLFAITATFVLAHAAFAGANPDVIGVVRVPEPGTLALIAAGLGGLVFAKFRKRK